jgi:hypothetical protein
MPLSLSESESRIAIWFFAFRPPIPDSDVFAGVAIQAGLSPMGIFTYP